MISFYKKSFAYRKCIVTAAFVLLLVGSLGAGFWFIIQSVKNADQSFQDIMNKIVSQEEDRERARGVDMLVKKREADIDRVKQFFIDRKEPVRFIEQLEEIARATRNKVILNIDEAKGETNVLAFRVSVQGSEASARKMLQLIDLMPYQIAVQDIAFEKEENVELLAKGGGEGHHAPSNLLLLLYIKAL